MHGFVSPLGMKGMDVCAAHAREEEAWERMTENAARRKALK